jgi:diguanylate cyclase (GGDEF)-like protein
MKEHRTKEQLRGELAEMRQRIAEWEASEPVHLSAEQAGKRTEEGLHIFKYMVENSIDAILLTDPDLQIVYSNRACNQLMAHNVTGQPLMSLWFEEDRPLLDSVIEWAKVSGLFSAARLNGFHRVIDQYPRIEIVGTLPADWNREKGSQAAEEFLKTNPPGTLDAIWAASGEMGLGTMLAVEAAGRQDEIKVFTNDVTPESAERMREGRLMAETHHGFPEWGWYGTKFAVMLALGQDVPPTFDIGPRTMYKDNADLFYPTPALEPIDWEGIKAGQKLPQKIVIGWIQAAASGVYQTATEYFERAAAEARQHGINVEVITQTPATPEDMAGQAAIIEDYIQCQVDAIVLSTIKVEVVRQAIKKASQTGIPVIIVNQLEPIEGIEVASYIGFDNTMVGAISAYAVVDYLGGPGILGEGEKVEVEPGTHLDLAWWQALYQDVDPRAIDVKGRVAIIEGISGNWRGENRLVRSDGSVVYADSITFPIHDEAGQFMGLVACFRDATQRKQAEEALRKAHDELEIRVEARTAELAEANKELQAEITERKRVEEELAYMATHDALTGLPNRWLFNDRLTLELARAYRYQQKLAVMLLDLDHFKDVNDTLGHSVGDRLLQVVGKRLTSLVRKSDTVARMGGDEFVLIFLFPGIREEEDTAKIARRLLEAFRRSFVFDDHEICITTSIGIAIYPDDGKDVDTLMRNADIAMYRAKAWGRDNYQRYTPDYER